MHLCIGRAIHLDLSVLETHPPVINLDLDPDTIISDCTIDTVQGHNVRSAADNLSTVALNNGSRYTNRTPVTSRKISDQSSYIF